MANCCRACGQLAIGRAHFWLILSGERVIGRQCVTFRRSLRAIREIRLTSVIRCSRLRHHDGRRAEMVALKVEQRSRDFCRDALCAKVIVFVKGRRAVDIDLIIVADVIGLRVADNLFHARAIAIIREGCRRWRRGWLAFSNGREKNRV